MSGEVETMAYSGAVPWHGLGQPVRPDMSPLEMLHSARCDWTVQKLPAFIKLTADELPEGTFIEKPIPRAALVRSSDGKILDTVPPAWEILQNEEAFEFFLDFVAKGNMEMHTAGSLKGGQIVWALARINNGFSINGRDDVESYLLFTNPWQFGKAIDIRFTPIRVVCWNTLSLALGKSGLTVDQQVVRTSHRKPFDADKVKRTLGLADQMLDEYRDAAQFIASKKAPGDLVDLFFRDIFPKNTTKPGDNEISRNHDRALRVLHSQPGADVAEGSWWQVFNAVTYMTDHLMGREADTRLESAWFGSNRALKSKALNAAVEMAKRSSDLEIAA